MAGSINDLSQYRFERAKEDLNVAKRLFDDGFYKQSLNRSYYAVFHALRSVNALDSFDSGKHSGVIAHFNRNYVKTGIFGKGTSKMITLISDFRDHADYEDYYEVSPEEAEDVFDKAASLIEEVEQYLKEKNII